MERYDRGDTMSPATEDGVEIGTLTRIPVEAPSVVDRTMIDIQVSTAKQFPRSNARGRRSMDRPPGSPR